jgi:Xaa-Pro dipeptidase
MGEGLQGMYRERIAGVQHWLKQVGNATGLVTGPVSMKYLCGWSNPSKRFAGLFIAAEGDPVLLVPALERAEASRSAIPRLEAWADGEDPFGRLASVVQGFGAGNLSLAVEKEFLPMATYERIATALGTSPAALLPQTADLGPVITQMRSVKSETELALMQKAADFVNPALEAAIAAIRPGVSEREIGDVIEQAMLQAGAHGVAFETHVLIGPNSALPHGHTGDRKAQPGDLVLMDFGARHEGYLSDITRTVCVGPWPDKLAEIYDIVLQAHDAAIAAAKPGVTLESVDQAARRIIAERGYGEYFIHRTGHGLGLEVHEEPYVVTGNQKVLEPGHVVTIEPGIYLPDLGGVRIEDDIVITADGCFSLTNWTTKRLSVGE